MKKILLTITGFVVTLLTMAQSPNIMNYQGVARNSVGNVLPSQPIGLKLSILNGGPTGTVVYSETRNVTTNAFGLFNVQVGSPGAITTTGTIAGINWTAFGTGSGTKYLQVEIDPVGGTSYFNVGSTQLVSVPYALNAGAAAPVGPAGGDLTGTYPNPLLRLPFIRTQSDAGPLFQITNSGAGSAIEGLNTGTGRGGYFVVNNATSTADAIRAETNGIGASWGIRAISSGTNGAGLFQQTNVTNTSNNLQSTQAGLGRAGFFVVSNAANAANAVEATTIGTGFALRAASTNAVPLALQTVGGVQHTGIGEAVNRILRSDATGNATWNTLASIGGVSGSGTLNFVPKWTPDGVTIGNSQIFDNGTNVGVGTITPTNKFTVAAGDNDGIAINNTGTNFANAALTFANTTTAPVRTNGAVISLKSGTTDRALQFFNYSPGLLPADISYNFLNSAAAPIVSVLNNGNVGLGQAAPTGKLEVVNTGTNPSLIINQNNAANTSFAIDASSNGTNTTISGINTGTGRGGYFQVNNATSTSDAIRAETNGIGASWGIRAISSGTNGAGLFQQTNPTNTANNLQSTQAGLGRSAFFTSANAANTANALEVTVAGTGYAIRAASSNAVPLALQTVGGVQLSGLGAATGNVLTSDAAGNATWQPSVSRSAGISLRGFTAGLVVPNNTFTPVTQWAVIDNEDGGANYNGTTGEYTIPVTGIYQINCSVAWTPGINASDMRIELYINGVFEYETADQSGTGGGYTFQNLSYSRRFLAGQRVNVLLYQNSGASQTTLGFSASNSLSIQYLHN